MHAIEARNLWFRYEGEWVIRGGVSWVVEPSRR